MSSHFVLQAAVFPLDVIFFTDKNPPIASKLMLQSFPFGFLSIAERHPLLSYITGGQGCRGGNTAANGGESREFFNQPEQLRNTTSLLCYYSQGQLLRS